MKRKMFNLLGGCIVGAFALGATAVTPTSIQLIDPLDDSRGWCVDLFAHLTGALPLGGLQGHNCFLYMGRGPTEDQAFDAELIEERGEIRIIHFDLCMTLHEPNPGSFVPIETCDDGEAQDFEMTTDGRIVPLMAPELCLTLARPPCPAAAGWHRWDGKRATTTTFLRFAGSLSRPAGTATRPSRRASAGSWWTPTRNALLPWRNGSDRVEPKAVRRTPVRYSRATPREFMGARTNDSSVSGAPGTKFRCAAKYSAFSPNILSSRALRRSTRPATAGLAPAVQTARSVPYHNSSVLPPNSTMVAPRAPRAAAKDMDSSNFGSASTTHPRRSLARAANDTGTEPNAMETPADFINSRRVSIWSPLVVMHESYTIEGKWQVIHPTNE